MHTLAVVLFITTFWGGNQLPLHELTVYENLRYSNGAWSQCRAMAASIQKDLDVYLGAKDAEYERRGSDLHHTWKAECVDLETGKQFQGVSALHQLR